MKAMPFSPKNLFFQCFSILVAGIFCLPLPAKAFSLSDHKHMMKQAIVEFNRCNPGSIGPLDGLQLWASDLEEDLNLVRKDLMFSHFYNPYKKLNMWRYDCSDRIKGLMLNLKLDSVMYGENSKDIYADLGHIAHHLQDMASPPHVVPLMHNLSDGFENDVDFEGDISSGLSCEEIKQQGVGLDYLTLLDNTGKETLKKIDDTQVPLQMIYAGKVYHPKANMSAFWLTGSGPHDFGQYGVLGNHYGATSFRQDGVTYQVPMSFYMTYKQSQLKLGVQATLRALSIYILNRPAN